MGVAGLSDLVIHIQHTEERQFYALERLWRTAPQIELGWMSADDCMLESSCGGTGVPSGTSTTDSRVKPTFPSIHWASPQAEPDARMLADYAPSALYSSDLSRAYTTAAALAAITGLEIRTDKRCGKSTSAAGGPWAVRWMPRIRVGPPPSRGRGRPPIANR